ncbi:hypothetical protein BV20DRAFT_961428 [Pilatotrama ljubarskyi]|nr:hypothetical protein BV20DRAFT_961428 [Pilatotrama ljubarskyi]
MTDTRTSRANTPRARVTQKTSQVARRASSVPAVGNKRPEYILDCVLMTPRKRKRTSSHEDAPTAGASQTRLGTLLCGSSQKKPAARTARARARSAEKEVSSTSRTGARSQKRASSPMAAVEKTPSRRRATSTSRTANNIPAEASSSQRRRTSSQASVALGKSGSTSRTSGATASARRNKGKAKAMPVDFETSSQSIAEDSADAESSTSGTRRGAKRRRLSPQLSLDADELSPTATVAEVEPDSQMTAVEEDFQMLELPDDVLLPWVPMDPDSKEPVYVPPGVNALVQDIKRALVSERSARQKAETMLAEELQRRRELEQEAARLAAANRALEGERSAWTADAAEALASTLESALVADMSRRLAKEVNLGVYSEEMQEDAETSVRNPDAGLSGPSFEGAATVQGDGHVEARARDGQPGETTSLAGSQT